MTLQTLSWIARALPQALQAKARAQAVVEAAAEAECAARRTVRAEAQQQDRPGPHLSFSTDRLLMLGVAGEEPTSTVVTESNTGTAAVYYRWCRSSSGQEYGQFSESSSVDGDDSEQVQSLSSPQTMAPEQAHRWPPPRGAVRFYLADQRGAILPGEAHKFAFSFKSAAAGVFTEEWSMATTPPLPAMGLRHRAGDPVQVGCPAHGRPVCGSGRHDSARSWMTEPCFLLAAALVDRPC